MLSCIATGATILGGVKGRAVTLVADVGDRSLDLETAHPTRAHKWSLEKGKPVLELGLAWSE